MPCATCAAGEGVVSVCSSRNVDTVCSACEEGQYSPGGNSTCLECDAAGDYCPKRAAFPARCKAGWFCVDTRSQEECGDGFYCPEGSTAAVLCAAGMFCVTPASQEPCSKGSYCLTGSQLPNSLSVGWYAVNDAGDQTTTAGVDQRECDAGWFCAAGNRTQCQAGQRCEPGASFPSPCAPGTKQPLPAQAACVDCSAGSFQDEEGQVGCKVCLKGHQCPTSGMQEAAPCASGQVAPGVGSVNCTTCPAGTYGASPGLGSALWFRARLIPLLSFRRRRKHPIVAAGTWRCSGPGGA